MIKRFWFLFLILALAVSMNGCVGAKTTSADTFPAAKDAVTVPNTGRESAASVTSTPVEEVTGAAPGKDTWLVMLYQDADDEVLEKDVFTDFNEAELIGSTDQVTIVSQIDRFVGGFNGDGDWTETRRYLLSQDDDLEHIKSEMVENMDELDSGDPQTLVDFATWAINTYPAEKYVLIISDHGSGWLGGWTDNDPKPDSAFKLSDIDNALQQIVSDTGIGQFEFFGFDACLMSQVESLSAIAPYAKYAAASEETEPSLGWSYSSFLKTLTEKPEMSGKELAEAIVEGYIVDDARITDDRARADLVKEAFEVTEEVSAEEVGAAMSEEVTLTAVDLSKIKELNAAINDLAISLSAADQKRVAQARTYAQSYESVFGDEEPPSYIDLGSFSELLAKKIDDKDVTAAVKNIQTAIKAAVIAEKHGDKRPGSTGFSLYFPNSATYKWTVPAGSEPSYQDFAFRFAEASLWDDFLNFHYTKKDIDQTAVNLDVLLPEGVAAVVPTAAPTEEKTEEAATPVEEEEGEATATVEPTEEPGEIVAPGAGEFAIADLTTSTNEITADEKVTISTEISGSNIGFIYIYTMYYNEDDNSFLTADIDFIDAGDTKEIEGVVYPDWGEDSVIPLEIDWDPTLFYITDGDEKNDQFALFEPDTYGAKSEDDVYTVRGTYIFSDSGNSREAVMEFNGEGKMKRVITFTKTNGSGAPHEVIPNPGDQFQITDSWLEFDADSEGEFVDHEGGTMTFGEKPFEWMPYKAFPGKYIVGIVVEDLDGNTVESWTDEITITE